MAARPWYRAPFPSIKIVTLFEGHRKAAGASIAAAERRNDTDVIAQ
jgi:hypothetical protein